MNDPEFFETLARYQDGSLAPEMVEALESALREDPERRRHFAEWQLRSMALHDHFRQEAFRVPAATPARGRKTTWPPLRPALAAAAGLVIGLFGASVVWAISTPDWTATASRVTGLGDAGFEEGKAGLIEPGFPRTTGRWAGDEAALVDLEGASEGGCVLQFVSPGADVAVPGGPAISCDVFQLVDLRSLRAAAAGEGEAILASGAAFVHTIGETKPEWHRLGAKCLVPPGAGFAVIQLAARPNLRPAELESLFADGVALTLTTRPDLPVKVVD
jgi:anti-sigma factor RsiW